MENSSKAYNTGWEVGAAEAASSAHYGKFESNWLCGRSLGILIAALLKRHNTGQHECIAEVLCVVFKETGVFFLGYRLELQVPLEGL